MRIQSQARTAICALMVLDAAEANELLPVRVVGQRIGVSVSNLEIVFKKLKKGGLIKSAMGRKGGYLLSRPFEEITLAELIEMVDDKTLPMASDEPVLGEKLWVEMEQLVISWLKDLKLSELKVEH